MLLSREQGDRRKKKEGASESLSSRVDTNHTDRTKQPIDAETAAILNTLSENVSRELLTSVDFFSHINVYPLHTIP